ncbi:MAG: C-terminal helicase domain-containing protein, partial [Planctomycetia bacterium]|nr:C-terminal helicase domain-containing protein [Planctomycetia bacterium]
MPFSYVLKSKISEYIDPSDARAANLSVAGREQGICRLTSINLLKRMESSVYSFRATVERILNIIRGTISLIDDFKNHKTSSAPCEEVVPQADDFDADDQNAELFAVGREFKIDLANMDYVKWQRLLQDDADHLNMLLQELQGIDPSHDAKLKTLFDLIDAKITNPRTPGNRKILIFTAFSDTAEYLYKHVSKFVQDKFQLHTALVTGSIDGRTTIPNFHCDLDHILMAFSPQSKGRDIISPDDHNDIDILIATDCISEGQNLQDCDYLINYDIHWNPVRIIQRFGRIDRIGSRNEYIQLV